MKIENAKIEKYSNYLIGERRPFSKGGNTKEYRHYVTINKIKYSFKALGTRQWVYKQDTVSFEYETNGEFKNIINNTLVTIDKKGVTIVRGIRGKV